MNKQNIISMFIDAIFSGRGIEIELVDDEKVVQPRDRKGRWSKEKTEVIFYGDLRNSFA